MRTFGKWDQLENMNCRVIISHELFGKQVYDCDMLQIINDEHRIGVKIKGRELFVNKQDVIEHWMYDTACTVRDKVMMISIVKKM